MSGAPLAIIPLRSFDAGKSRLSAVLDVAARQALIEAMLCDVLAALTLSGITDVQVAACGEHAAEVAARLGVPAVRDESRTGGLNRALSDVVAAARRTHHTVVIVAADLPRISGADLVDVLEAPTPVVIAPTHDNGTAVLRLSPADVIPLAYGPQSATIHAHRAKACGRQVTVLRRASLLYDLDTPADLEYAYRQAIGEIAAGTLGAHTRRSLAGMPPTVLNAATLPPSA